MKPLRLSITAVAVSCFFFTFLQAASVKAGVAPSVASLTAVHVLQAQGSSPHSSSKVAGSSALESFSASGLFNERLILSLFRGEFEDIDLAREDMSFEGFFQQYLNAYARVCSGQLPKDRVEMTVSECATEQVTRNGFGTEISRYCVRYVTVGTGLYADPNLYAAKVEVDRLIAADTFRNLGRILVLMQRGGFSGAMSMAHSVQTAAADMNALLRMNSCRSPGLMRFQENLRRFALNEEPIRFATSEKRDPSRSSSAATPFTDGDFRSLIEDLVADQARSWVVNRYVPGSITDVSIASRDAEGRATRVSAWYTFDGMNGRDRGSVDVHLIDGTPNCLYFYDSPASCRTPSRRVVSRHRERAATMVHSQQAASPPASANGKVSTAVAAVDLKPPEVVPEESAPTPVPSPEVPPAPPRELRAVSYIQGIKDACLEVMTGGVEREPEMSFCYCLSASVGSVRVSEIDVRWYFENFSEAATEELERRYPELRRRFGSCRAQRDVASEPE